MSEIWDSIMRVQDSADPMVWQAEYSRLVPLLKASWSHPHSAMELLECAAEVFPLALAKELVYEVVREWKEQPSYGWAAGGSASHCYLSALLLTGNVALADPELIAKYHDEVLRKARNPRARTRDADTKTNLLVAAL